MSDVSAGSTSHPPARRRRRLRLAPIRLLCVMLFGVVVAKVGFDWPAFSDPVPWEIKHSVADRPDLIGRADVYDFWGNFIDSQHLWQVEVSVEAIPALVRDFRVRELTGAEEVPDDFWGQMPYWWRPPRTGPARYFISPGFQTDTRGIDGHFYLMAYDEAAGVLYVWFKNNF